MDPAIGVVAHYLAPVLASLIVFGMPVAIVFIVKHFKLKDRELDLEAQLHSKDLELRLRTMEARQAAVEAALSAMGGRAMASPQDRLPMLESPPSAESTESPAPSGRLRSR